MSGDETNKTISTEDALGSGAEQPTNPTPGTSNSAENNTPKPEQSSRQSNLQRIKQRKQQVMNLPQEKKFRKIACYMQCQGQDCKCVGWKGFQENSCHVCSHSMETHVSHLEFLTEEKINHLLNMVLDTDNVFKAMHREEDPDTKRVYYYLFKVLRKSILAIEKPIVDAPLGQPPFEEPCISTAVISFVHYKFAHLEEWRSMYDVAKMFLHCLEFWNYLNPSAQAKIAGPDIAYQINFTRWLVFCHVPMFLDSLPRFYTTSVFGKTMLRAVFKSMSKQLTENCRREKDKLPAEKRIVINNLPRFLSMLEPEIYAEDSCMWDPNYRPILLDLAADDDYGLVNEVERVIDMFDDEDDFARSA